MAFYKYGFISTLQEEIKERIQCGEITSEDQVYDFVSKEVQTACIYYADCFDIIKELNFTDFRNSEFEITDVSTAAYAALLEFTQETLDFIDIEQTLKGINV